jgi:hypothetical protein
MNKNKFKIFSLERHHQISYFFKIYIENKYLIHLFCSFIIFTFLRFNINQKYYIRYFNCLKISFNHEFLSK